MDTRMNTSPLDELLLTEDEVSEELLADLLKPYVWILRNGQDFIFTEPGEGLDNRRKILILLLSRKAARLLDLPTNEPASPKEIEQATGIPGGSVRPVLRDLLDDRLVRRDDNGAYYVPSYALHKVRRLYDGVV